MTKEEIKKIHEPGIVKSLLIWALEIIIRSNESDVEAAVFLKKSIKTVLDKMKQICKDQNEHQATMMSGKMDQALIDEFKEFITSSYNEECEKIQGEVLNIIDKLSKLNDQQEIQSTESDGLPDFSSFFGKM